MPSVIAKRPAPFTARPIVHRDVPAKHGRKIQKVHVNTIHIRTAYDVAISRRSAPEERFFFRGALQHFAYYTAHGRTINARHRRGRRLILAAEPDLLLSTIWRRNRHDRLAVRSNKGVAVTREARNCSRSPDAARQAEHHAGGTFGAGRRRDPRFSVSCQRIPFSAVNAFVEGSDSTTPTGRLHAARDAVMPRQIVDDVASGRSELGLLCARATRASPSCTQDELVFEEKP